MPPDDRFPRPSGLVLAGLASFLAPGVMGLWEWPFVGFTWAVGAGCLVRAASTRPAPSPAPTTTPESHGPSGLGKWEAMPYPPVEGVWFVVDTSRAVFFAGEDPGRFALECAGRMTAPTPHHPD